MKESISWENDICILQQGNAIYLQNGLDEDIKTLEYSTFSMFTDDDQIALSSTPSYRIQDIPKNSIVLLETLDPYEDGSIYYQLNKLESANIHFSGSLNLNKKKRSRMVTLPDAVPVNIEKISNAEGFVVHLDHQDDMNKLYWIAEDLKSYTDLTGNRFDIEHAQRRIWQMQAVLKEYHHLSIKELITALENQLEVAAAFDKETFSATVDQFFALMTKIKNT